MDSMLNILCNDRCTCGVTLNTALHWWPVGWQDERKQSNYGRSCNTCFNVLHESGLDPHALIFSRLKYCKFAPTSAQLFHVFCIRERHYLIVTSDRQTLFSFIGFLSSVRESILSWFLLHRKPERENGPHIISRKSNCVNFICKFTYFLRSVLEKKNQGFCCIIAVTVQKLNVVHARKSHRFFPRQSTERQQPTGESRSVIILL